jgi:DNA-binding response OmpR family regulator
VGQAHFVEDVEHYAEQYMKVLQAHFGVDHVKHVKTARRALTELNDRPPDVLVADLHIPLNQTMSFLLRLRSYHASAATTPTVLISAP